jgi:hypothetical protein
MFGTLKGFAKFLLDSPAKNKNLNDSRHYINLNNHPVSKVALSEKSFLVYSDSSSKLIYLSENL